MLRELKLNRIGLTMETGTVVRWLKTEGDYVSQDEPVVEVESDKATSVIESLYSGRIAKILVNEGEEVPVETALALLEDSGMPD